MKSETLGVAIIGCSLILAASLGAKQRRMQKSDLPEAVQKTVDEQSKGATIKGYGTEIDNGKKEYEVEMMVDGRSKDVTMDKEGGVLEIEEQVDMEKLPAEVQAGLREKAAGAKITKVESLTKGGKLVAYEAQVRSGRKHSEIQVGPEGKALAHPE